MLRCKEEDKQARAELLDELELAKNGDLVEEVEQPLPPPQEESNQRNTGFIKRENNDLGSDTTARQATTLDLRTIKLTTFCISLIYGVVH